MRVAIQGTHGSFSEAAARRRWPDLVTLPCREAKDVVVTTPSEIDRRRNSVGSVLWPALREGKVLHERA